MVSVNLSLKNWWGLKKTGKDAVNELRLSLLSQTVLRWRPVEVRVIKINNLSIQI